ncbi:MAG: hypothetical protein DLM63_04940 [Solirubrobacterales bacterium]|nr:MAG: hypothetical protein DLM63_04940 [Solirubrobacterales bacterium]
MHAVPLPRYQTPMDLLADPLRTAEFLAVDVETNGRSGAECELTEVGAVLVGGGELHERFSAVVSVQRPLGRGIQRFTGITQEMVDDGECPDGVLGHLGELLEGRVLVAHSAAFDRRVLCGAFAASGLAWPAPPTLCTVALARRFAPLVGERRLGSLAAALGIDVAAAHRALPDAETCARVFCALFPRLCAHAATVADALAALAPRRRATSRHPARVRASPPRPPPGLRFDALPGEPGVYLFRDELGEALYVGKSISLRSRARAHFHPGAQEGAWTARAAVVDHRPTGSELGALVLENRLIKELLPAGNVRLRRLDRYVYLRCRLDIPYPVLEVAPTPAPYRAINIGPLRGRAAAAELVEQLNSLFGLRHCGRRLARRRFPSAYGQMGRCLSPCLGNLDPNLYRRRLEEALAVLGAGSARLLAHVDEQMRAAAAEYRYERAGALRRRQKRLGMLLERVGGVIAATHARSRLVLAPHPRGADAGPGDALWLVAGRLVDWGRRPGLEELSVRSAAALVNVTPTDPPGSAWIPAEEVDEVRIIAVWLATHPEACVIDLRDAAEPERLAALAGHRLAASS